MKRIVILIDGTWNKEGDGADTNVAKLDRKSSSGLVSFIKPTASDGTIQNVHYHPGVGTNGGILLRLLGGALGLGLKQIVQESYNLVVADYRPGDHIFILGFSRGSYAARALAGLIGASGIQCQKNDEHFSVAWNHYRTNPKHREAVDLPLETARLFADRNAFHEHRSIKCVGVWDTVGSYGVPAGFGLDSLARYVTLALLGFHDTHIGDNVDYGLHALAIDERRRPFAPTFWTKPKGQKIKTHVEQVWFAGVHSNVGGGYAESGLSDRALIWMIARIEALTKLEFNTSAVKMKTRPNLDGEVADSSKGWPISSLFPYHRPIFSPDAIHGAFLSKKNPSEEHINELVHWSVLEKRGRPCTVFGAIATPYNPPNLPTDIPEARIAEPTLGERLMSPDELSHDDKNKLQA